VPAGFEDAAAFAEVGGGVFEVFGDPLGYDEVEGFVGEWEAAHGGHDAAVGDGVCAEAGEVYVDADDAMGFAECGEVGVASATACVEDEGFGGDVLRDECVEGAVDFAYPLVDEGDFFGAEFFAEFSDVDVERVFGVGVVLVMNLLCHRLLREKLWVVLGVGSLACRRR
jgi:hypothetical protein